MTQGDETENDREEEAIIGCLGRALSDSAAETLYCPKQTDVEQYECKVFQEERPACDEVRTC